jgi:hypothetical protein
VTNIYIPHPPRASSLASGETLATELTKCFKLSATKRR